jgi:hypothetical protein
MRKTIATLLIFLISAPAIANDLSILVNGKALHLQHRPNANYNEGNWGLGVQYDWTGRNWIPFATASGFLDSNSNPSYYAGGGLLRRFVVGDNLHADVGFIAFAMTRKDYQHGEPFIGILPALSFGSSRVALNVTYIPAVEPKMVPVIFLQLKISLQEAR